METRIFGLLLGIAVAFASAETDKNVSKDYEASLRPAVMQKRSISNIARLLLGGAPSYGSHVKWNPWHEPKSFSLANNIVSALPAAAFLVGSVAAPGAGWVANTPYQNIQQLVHTKTKLLPYTGQVASGLTGIAAVKGDILKQLHAISTQAFAQAAADAAAKALAGAAAANAVTHSLSGALHPVAHTGWNAGWSAPQNVYDKFPAVDVTPPYHSNAHTYQYKAPAHNHLYSASAAAPVTTFARTAETPAAPVESPSLVSTMVNLLTAAYLSSANPAASPNLLQTGSAPQFAYQQPPVVAYAPQAAPTAAPNPYFQATAYTGVAAPAASNLGYTVTPTGGYQRMSNYPSNSNEQKRRRISLGSEPLQFEITLPTEDLQRDMSTAKLVQKLTLGMSPDKSSLVLNLDDPTGRAEIRPVQGAYRVEKVQSANRYIASRRNEPVYDEDEDSSNLESDEGYSTGSLDERLGPAVAPVLTAEEDENISASEPEPKSWISEDKSQAFSLKQIQDEEKRQSVVALIQRLA